MIFQYFVVWQSSYCMLSKEKVYTYCQCVTFICNFSQLLPYSLNPVHLFLICLYQALITASYTSRIWLFPCKSWLDLYLGLFVQSRDWNPRLSPDWKHPQTPCSARSAVPPYWLSNITFLPLWVPFSLWNSMLSPLPTVHEGPGSQESFF